MSGISFSGRETRSRIRSSRVRMIGPEHDGLWAGISSGPSPPCPSETAPPTLPIRSGKLA
jgi:hypothetical protein